MLRRFDGGRGRSDVDRAVARLVRDRVGDQLADCSSSSTTSTTLRACALVSTTRLPDQGEQRSALITERHRSVVWLMRLWVVSADREAVIGP